MMEKRNSVNAVWHEIGFRETPIPLLPEGRTKRERQNSFKARAESTDKKYEKKR
jgi:hypothetical protein